VVRSDGTEGPTVIDGITGPRNVAKLSCVAVRRAAARPKQSASSFMKGQQVVTQEGLREALWMFEISGGRVVQGQGYPDLTPGDTPRILSSRYAFCADLPLSSDL